MTTEIKKLNIGQKIRSLRESFGKTAEDFADELGLEASLLKKMEINEVSPPISILLNIAHQCGVELGYFLGVGKEARPYTVIKKGTEKKVKRVFPQGKNPLSYSYKTLAAEKTNKHMEPFLVEFSASKEKVPQVAHGGEEFVYVLEGKLRIHIRNERVTIKKGDSLYLESKYPHSFRAIGNRKAKAIVVLYPH